MEKNVLMVLPGCVPNRTTGRCGGLLWGHWRKWGWGGVWGPHSPGAATTPSATTLSILVCEEPAGADRPEPRLPLGVTSTLVVHGLLFEVDSPPFCAKYLCWVIMLGLKRDKCCTLSLQLTTDDVGKKTWGIYRLGVCVAHVFWWNVFSVPAFSLCSKTCSSLCFKFLLLGGWESGMQ